MNRNRFLALAMAGAMTLAAATPAFAVESNDGKATGTTEVSLTVASKNTYTMTVPAATTLNSDGTATALTNGITISGGTLEEGKKLTVTATSDNDWKMSASGVDTTIGYSLYSDAGTTEATTWEFTQTEANAAGGATKAVYAKPDADALNDAESGTYSDVITFTAEVVDAEIAVTSVSLDMGKLRVEAGSTAKLIATVTPDDATDKTVTWTSSDTSVARVDHNGLVTARISGSATVTATAGGKSATCEVEVW